MTFLGEKEKTEDETKIMGDGEGNCKKKRKVEIKLPRTRGSVREKGKVGGGIRGQPKEEIGGGKERKKKRNPRGLRPLHLQGRSPHEEVQPERGRSDRHDEHPRFPVHGSAHRLQVQRRHCPAATPAVTITNATDIIATVTVATVVATVTVACLLPSGEKGVDEAEGALLPVALEGGLVKVA